jgi:Icc protein
MMSRNAAAEEQMVRFLQISDIHSMNGSALLGGAADISARLTSLMELLTTMGAMPDAVLLTGDLVDRTGNFEYGEVAEFRAVLEAALSCPVIAMMGNHDNRAAFDSAFGDLPGAALTRPGDLHDKVWEVCGIRVVVLDSTVPGRSYGELSRDQLAWLREILADPAPGGTLLTMHHPPILSPMPQLRFSGLRNPEELAKVLGGGDVRAIITGHFHHTEAAWWQNCLVWCGPALSYSQDVLVRSPRIRGWNRGQFSLIEMNRDVVTASVIEFPDVLGAPVLDYRLDVDEKQRQWTEAQ